MTDERIPSDTADIDHARQVLAEPEGIAFGEKLRWIERSIKAIESTKG